MTNSKPNTPNGFFRDKRGVVHPIFETNSGRHPAKSAEDWKKSLLFQHSISLNSWTDLSNSMKNVITESDPLRDHDPDAIANVNFLQEAIDTAPEYHGTIFRGLNDISEDKFEKLINAKTLKAHSPISFSSNPTLAHEFGRAAKADENTAWISAEKHNAADVSSETNRRAPGEDEVIVPEGSRYKVDHIDVMPNLYGGRHALIQVSLDTEPEKPDTAELSATQGSPTGYFKDKAGHTHPIFTSPGGQREPIPDAESWKDSLSGPQRKAIERWSLIVPNREMKKEATGTSHRNPDDRLHEYLTDTNAGGVSWGKRLNDFNQALHTAPVANGTVFRGLNNLTNVAFNKLTKASVLEAKSPVSFTTDEHSFFIPKADIPHTTDIAIVATKHNAGDISSQIHDYDEHEAVIPQGSRYRVVSRMFQKKPGGGRWARLEVELDQGAKEPTVAMAGSPTGYFTRDGKRIPIFTSPGGHREPMADTESWKSSLGPDQIHAIKRWIMGGYGDPEAGHRDWLGMKAAAKGESEYGAMTYLVRPKVDNTDKQDIDAFNRAIHTAPATDKRIGRLVNGLSDDVYNKLVSAKYLKANSPASFSVRGLGDEGVRTTDEPPYNVDQTHHVKIVSDDHNAADLRAYNDIENEAVVPQGGLYKVDRVETKDFPAFAGYPEYNMKPTPGHPQTATIHVSYVPKDEGQESVEMSAPVGSPTGFFKDKQGNTHPIFRSAGGVRHPMEKDEWVNSLSENEKSAIYQWTSDSQPFKDTARDVYPYNSGGGKNEDWKSALNDFNTAIDRAPTYQGDIYRGIHSLSDKAFDAIVKAKSFRAKSPTSFSGTREAGQGFGDPRTHFGNGIVFVSKEGQHNGGSILPANRKQIGYSNENEVIVPHGSVYKVDKVRIRHGVQNIDVGGGNPLRNTRGDQAWIYIHHEPNAPEEKKTIKLAHVDYPAKGFFRDEEGKVHPIFESSKRSPMKTQRDWKASLSEDELEALDNWQGGATTFKNDIQLDRQDSGTNWAKMIVNHVNTAVHRAPSYRGTIYRGVHDLSDETFDRITNAHAFRAKSPSSFSGNAAEAKRFAHHGLEHEGHHSVLFVATKHNGGSVRSALTGPETNYEDEVIVPQGSTYGVDDVTVSGGGTPGTIHYSGGKHAVIHIHKIDDKSADEKVELASADTVELDRDGNPVKYSKSEVDYESPARGTDHCMQCQNFMSPDSCLRVNGKVHPDDWCKLFLVNKVELAASQSEQHFFTDSEGKVHPLSGSDTNQRMNQFIEQGQNVWKPEVRGGAKNTLVTEIARRMGEDPETVKAVAGMHGKADPQTMYNQANYLVRGWAAMAGQNDNPTAVAHHLAAAKEFHLDSTPYTKDPDALAEARRILASNGGNYEKMYRGYLRAEYANTQDQLKKAGIDHVTLTRGMTWDPSETPDWAKKLKGRSGGGTALEVTSEDNPEKINLPLQPVTSWTSNPKTAVPLGAASTPAEMYQRELGRSTFVNLKSNVPRERILSTARTGRGALPEYEVTVLGGPTDVEATRLDHSKNNSFGQTAVYPSGESDRAMFAFYNTDLGDGVPTGFFKDKQGKTHPIFESNSRNRHPDPKWAPTLDQSDALKNWSFGGYDYMKRISAGERLPDARKHNYLSHLLSDFNEAVDKAPAVKASEFLSDQSTPPIYRGIGNLSKATFDALVKAKTLSSNSQVSFTAMNLKGLPLDTELITGDLFGTPDKNSVLFVADKHNAADISQYSEFQQEREAIVPKNTPFHVTGVETTSEGKTSGAKHAVIHISMFGDDEPDPPKDKKVHLAAPQKFFTDEHGNVHPLTESMDHSVRHPMAIGTPTGFYKDRQGNTHPFFKSSPGRNPKANAEEWKKSLTPDQKTALFGWASQDSPKMKRIVSKGMEPQDSGLFGEGVDNLQRAIDTAPVFDGPIYRAAPNLSSRVFDKIVKSKVLLAKGPSSFTKDESVSHTFSATKSNGKHLVRFIAVIHNGGDVSSITDSNRDRPESEIIVPSGSPYRVDAVNVDASDPRNKIADVYISHSPNEQTNEKTAAMADVTSKFAEGRPEGYFKDREGNTRPIFESAQRHPTSNPHEWLSRLTPDQKMAVRAWSQTTNNKWMRSTARHQPAEMMDAPGVYSMIDDFNRAVDTAPGLPSLEEGYENGKAVKNKPWAIHRGLHDLSDKAFEKIVGAKYLKANGPVSFTRGGFTADNYFVRNRDPRKNNITIHATHHNGADIASAVAKRYQREGEVIVPQGSVYRVDDVRTYTSPLHTKRHAEIYISLADEPKADTVEMAATPTGFFKDNQGKKFFTDQLGYLHRKANRAQGPKGTAGSYRFELDKHNAADVTSYTDQQVTPGSSIPLEKEAIVPPNSLYLTDSVSVEPGSSTAVPYNGPKYKVATIHITYVPAVAGKTVELSRSVVKEPDEKASLAMPKDNEMANEVHDYLALNYPLEDLQWVSKAKWIRTSIPISKIDLEGDEDRKNPPRDTETKALLDYVKRGKDVDPVVLVAKKRGRYTIVDGHHRTRAYLILHKPDIQAYVGTLPGYADPWKSQHAAGGIYRAIAGLSAEEFDRLGRAKYVRVHNGSFTTHPEKAMWRDRKDQENDVVIRADNHNGEPVNDDEVQVPEGSLYKINNVRMTHHISSMNQGQHAEINISYVPEESKHASYNEDTVSFEAGEDEDVGEWENECERKWGVDPSKLPSLPVPWCLLQAYWAPKDGMVRSLRVISARGLAFMREKSAIYGTSRMKLSKPVDYKTALNLLHEAPRIALKKRYLVRDNDGRAWLIDYMPQFGHWQCESEIPNPDYPLKKPSWATDELTDSKYGFTVTYAKPFNSADIDRLIQEAADCGSSAPYLPSEDSSWEWEEKPTRTANGFHTALKRVLGQK